MRSGLGRNADFRRLFLAHSISRAGDAFNTVALVVLVFNLTASGLGVAGMVAFEIIPALLLAPAAGVIVDRYPRRSLMMKADLGRCVLALSIALISDSVGLAYMVAFGLSALTQIFNPAAGATLPEVVEPEELVSANAALWTSAVVAQIILAPVAGALIAVYGTGPAFGLNGVSYLASAAMLSRRGAGRSPGTAGERRWREVLQGLEAVRAHPLLARLALVQAFAALSASATSGLLVVLASQQLGVGAPGFGLLLSAIGIGAASGPVLLSRFIQPGDPRWLFGPYALRGAVDLSLSAITSLPAAIPALALYGVATSTGMIAYQSTLQREVPSDVRGRVFALYDMVWNSARLISLAVGGVIADSLGVSTVYAGAGVLLLVAFFVGSIDVPESVARTKGGIDDE